MKRYGVIQIQKEHWHGAQIICVDAMPASIPSDLLPQLVAMCSAAGISLELCLLNDLEAVNQLRALVILRADNPTLRGVSARLDEMAGQVGGMLAGAGFRVHPVNAVEKENPSHIREYEGLRNRLNEPMQGLICFPEENRSLQKYYVPASWADLKPVDLEALVTLLARNRGSMLSLALDCTALKLPELRMIDRNCGWLSTRGDDEETRRAMARYRALLDWQGKPLFRMRMLMRGDETTLRELAFAVSKMGVGAATMPAEVLANADYLSAGDLITGEYADAFGHSGSSDDIAPALCRLSHLVDADEPPKRVRIPSGLRLPGIPINRLPVDAEPLPGSMTHSSGICLGEHASSGASLTIQPIALTRHTVLAGTPGSGKTVFAAELLNQLWKRGIPFLVIETSGGAYRGLTKSIPEIQVYTPGRSNVSPMRINPFVPPRGVALETYLPGIASAFAAGLGLGSSAAQALDEALRACYIRHGWRSDSTRDSAGVRPFGMYDFLMDIRRHGCIETSAEARTCAACIAQLLDENPLLYDADRSTSDLFTRPTVIELSAMEKSVQRPLLLMILLTQAMHQIRAGGTRGTGLKHVILVDEAHEAFGGSSTPAARLLQDLAAVSSTFGTGLILSDLSPEKISSGIASTAKLKIMLRQNNAMDNSFAAVSAALPQLPAGEAFVYTDELGRAVHVKLRDGRGLSRFVSDKDVARHMERALMPPFGDCGSCGSCTLAVRLEGDFIARSICQEHLPKLETREQLLRFLRADVNAAIAEHLRLRGVSKDADRITACARANLKRRILLLNCFGIADEPNK